MALLLITLSYVYSVTWLQCEFSSWHLHLRYTCSFAWFAATNNITLSMQPPFKLPLWNQSHCEVADVTHFYNNVQNNKQLRNCNTYVHWIIKGLATVCTVQLRCNFTLAREPFTCTFVQFTCICTELFMVCALLPTRNLCKIIRWSSGVVFDTGEHVSLWYHVIDHHNVHRLVLRLVSCSQNLCHRALIH